VACTVSAGVPAILMITDLDIYRAANRLIGYDDGALTEAPQMINRMLADGDDEGRIVWPRSKRGSRHCRRPHRASA
jgi:hypothetical protein